MDRISDFAGRHADEWATLLWHSAWQGAITGIVALALVSLGRRWPAPMRYGILVLALLKFVMPPLMVLPTGIFGLVRVNDARISSSAPPQTVEPIRHDGAAELAIIAAPPRQEPLPQSEASPAPDGPPVNQATPGAPRTTVGNVSHAELVSSTSGKWQLTAILMLAHAAGTMLFLALYALRVYRLHACWDWMLHPSRDVADRTREIARQLGLRHAPAVRLSRDTQVPYSAGLLRRIVILPASHIQDFSAADLHAVLCHELAHHRRGDLFINFLQVAIGALWWFHPVVWLLNRKIRSVREDCCDDLLLSRKFVSDESYCKTLLRVAQVCGRRAAAAPVCVSIADGLHPLARRIRRIMDPSLPRRDHTGIAAMLALLALAVVILPGAKAVTADSRRADVGGAALTSDELLTGAAPTDGDTASQQSGNANAVFGRVTDGQGAPVAGATVALGQYFDNFNEPRLTKSASDGTYRLEHCPAGDSLLTIFKVGLAPHTQTVTIGVDSDEFNVALRPGRSLSIHVTDKNGEPISGAAVWPFQWADTVTLTQLHNFGKTNAEGDWNWGWAPDKDLPYLITKPAYMDYKYATLRPADEVHHVTLSPELRVTVNVVDDATSLPIRRFRATLGLLNPQSSAHEQWLSPVDVRSGKGEHTLRQSAIPWQECAVRIEADGYAPATSRSIHADEQNASVEIRLRAVGRRIAVVVDEDGTPVTGAAVYLGTETTPVDLLAVRTTPSRRGFVARTDREGRFPFDIQGGKSTLFVVASSGLGIAASHELNAASAEIVQIQIKPWASVEGIVRNGQKLLPDESIDLAVLADGLGARSTPPIVGLANGVFQTVRSDKDGRFIFDRVPPGLDVRIGHRVSIATPRGLMLGYGHEAYFKPAAGEVHAITLGGAGRPVIGRFRMKDEAWGVDWEASFGHIDPAAKPGEVDILYRPNPRFRIQQDGSFHLEEIPPGKYVIAFEHLALKSDSSLKKKSLSGLVIDTVTVPDGADGDAAAAVDLGLLPVGFSEVPNRDSK